MLQTCHKCYREKYLGRHIRKTFAIQQFNPQYQSAGEQCLTNKTEKRQKHKVFSQRARVDLLMLYLIKYFDVAIAGNATRDEEKPQQEEQQRRSQNVLCCVAMQLERI